MLYVCYYVSHVEDEEGLYEDFIFLDELGAHTTEKGAYDALLNWARHIFGSHHEISVSGDETRARVYVDHREYCVGCIELHEDE